MKTLIAFEQSVTMRRAFLERGMCAAAADQWGGFAMKDVASMTPTTGDSNE